MMNLASEVLIRSATADDGPALGRLGALLMAVHHAFDERRFIAPGPRAATEYARFLASQLNRKAVIILVAEAGGAVIGYAYATLEGRDWLSLRGPAGVLHDILIDPACRRSGVGKRLVEAVVEALTSRGAPQVVLSRAVQNAAAQRLFEAAGFRSTMVEMTKDSGD